MCSHCVAVWKFLKTPKMELPYDPAVESVYPNRKKNKNTNSKGYLHLSVHNIMLYCSCQDMEVTLSVNRHMDKEDVVYKYDEILLRRKNEILLLAAAGMDFERIMLIELSQVEEDKVLHVGSKK